MSKIKDVLSKYNKRILIYCCIIILFFIMLDYILTNFFEVQFRQWIYTFIIILSVLLFIDLIVTIFIKVTKGINKRIIIAILSVFTILTIFFFRIVGLVIWVSLVILDKTEHVVVIDSKKYVATVVDRFLDTDVEYYDYINFLLKGNKKKMSKTYKRFF